MGTGVEIRPSKDGTYSGDLVRGEYYVVAVDVTTRKDWQGVDVLEGLAKGAQTVRLGVGQKVRVDLILPRGK